jgi:hypothetical protein
MRAGETQPVAVRKIGPDLVFGRLWQESGVPEALRTLLKGRRFEFDLERALYLTVIDRLFASGRDRAAERWRDDYLLPGTEGLGLHHLYSGDGLFGRAAPGQSATLKRPGALHQRPIRRDAL